MSRKVSREPSSLVTAKMRKQKLNIKVLLLILLAMLVLTGCGEVGSLLGTVPDPDVVGREAYDTAVDGDYSVVVKVDIINRGDSGDVEVVGEVWWQGSYWKESKLVYLPAGAEREVYLVFKGPTFFGSFFGILTGQAGFKYRVQVEPL